MADPVFGATLAARASRAFLRGAVSYARSAVWQRMGGHRAAAMAACEGNRSMAEGLYMASEALAAFRGEHRGDGYEH